jgi:hypothetical protein
MQGEIDRHRDEVWNSVMLLPLWPFVLLIIPCPSDLIYPPCTPPQPPSLPSRPLPHLHHPPHALPSSSLLLSLSLSLIPLPSRLILNLIIRPSHVFSAYPVIVDGGVTQDGLVDLVDYLVGCCGIVGEGGGLAGPGTGVVGCAWVGCGDVCGGGGGALKRGW